MTLATITALINSKIRNKTPKVLKVEHADVEQAIVDEMYSTDVYNDGVSPLNDIINKLNPDIYININIEKSANKVFIRGFIFNESTQTFFYNDFAEIVNADYFPKFGLWHIINTCAETSNTAPLIIKDDKKIIIAGNIPALDTIYFNGFYTTE